VLIFFVVPIILSAQAKKITSLKGTSEIYSTFSSVSNRQVRPGYFPISIVKGNYYTQHMGFICKKEMALERAIKIPLRIRIGSLQQCNYLEGKK
jgi:hypothetical protein